MPLDHSVVIAKQRLAEGRAKLREQHDRGSPGIQVCARLTDLADEVILELFEAVLKELGEDGPDGLRRHVALVPGGGYGRREIAPASDIDLMILHEPGYDSRVAPLAQRMLQNVFDVGFDLGQSVRTVSQCCQLARGDGTIYTSLTETRFLAGNESLYQRFAARYAKFSSRRRRSLVTMIEQARREERLQYGETVYLLEPNVKRSKGGLRDIQFLRWLGYAGYGAADPDGLRMQGVLDDDERRQLRRALEFLLRLRNELHFHSGKAQDVLTKSEQLRLASLFEYQGSDGLLPVEQFMREYFQRTGEVYSIVKRFLAAVRPAARLKSLLAPLLSHHAEGDFRVGPYHISATRRGLAKIRGDLGQILRLCDLANQYDKRIDHLTWEAVRAAAGELSTDLTPEQSHRFLSLLAQPAQLGQLLHRLHDLGVLEKILPEFAHAHSLLQFNEYHKYTVDEHCLRAVEECSDLITAEGLPGEVYRRIKQKRTLHLALLIHDLGKGHPEDHSELGLKIAERTAQRLRLPLREAESLKYLVHKHLTLSHLALRRDTTDERVVVDFAVEVGSPEVLRMLYVLTVADIAAVGPGTLNNWKLDLLSDLYTRTMEHLAGDTPSMSTAERLRQRRSEIRACLGSQDDSQWFESQIEALPLPYLYGTPAEKIGAELRRLKRIEPGGAESWGRYVPERDAIEYTVGTHEQKAAGIFHRLTGALTSQGLQILSAEINTLAGGVVLDRFHVHDPDYQDQPPPERIEAVTRALVGSLEEAAEETPKFRKVWRPTTGAGGQVLSVLPTRVRLDNSTSEAYSVIDVFAHDRMGLLYAITRCLFELGLSVHVAKIGTYLDQVVDVFYVTDRQGRKIEDERYLDEIRNRLLAAVVEPAAVR